MPAGSACHEAGVGTRGWAAPETESPGAGGYGAAADLYSLGLVLRECMTCWAGLDGLRNTAFARVCDALVAPDAAGRGTASAHLVTVAALLERPHRQ